jgi:hypothetical protein
VISIFGGGWGRDLKSLQTATTIAGLQLLRGPVLILVFSHSITKETTLSKIGGPNKKTYLEYKSFSLALDSLSPGRIGCLKTEVGGFIPICNWLNISVSE